MRIAVISDIHGNSAALAAVLDDIDRADITRIVNLGDSLSGPLDPAGTADMLIARGIPGIAGNHDRMLLEPTSGPPPLWEEWTLPLLAPGHFDWLRAQPAIRDLHGVTLTHGTPASDTENWLHRRAPDGGMRAATLPECLAPAEGLDAPVILSGHTHMPRVVRLPDDRLLVNPGPVGCPAYLDPRHEPPFFAETGTPDAFYAVLELQGGRWRAGLRLVPYDASDMVARARALGAEEWVRALETGWAR